jgi:hypothetical protein
MSEPSASFSASAASTSLLASRPASPSWTPKPGDAPAALEESQSAEFAYESGGADQERTLRLATPSHVKLANHRKILMQYARGRVISVWARLVHCRGLRSWLTAGWLRGRIVTRDDPNGRRLPATADTTKSAQAAVTVLPVVWDHLPVAQMGPKQQLQGAAATSALTVASCRRELLARGYLEHRLAQATSGRLERPTDLADPSCPINIRQRIRQRILSRVPR